MDQRNKLTHVGRKKFSLLIVLIFLNIGFVLISCVQKFSGTITTKGVKFDQEQAKVLITSLENKSIEPKLLEVDQNGTFSYEVQHSGEYLVEAIVPGFKVKSERILLKKSSVHLDFPLEPLNASQVRTYDLIDTKNSESSQGSVYLNIPAF
ncbi:MAG: hypothetical protein KBD78_01840 [Oligoflexales bacterium]|nr:hypothetical protein [Oligoflexales bacterium]